MSREGVRLIEVPSTSGVLYIGGGWQWWTDRIEQGRLAQLAPGELSSSNLGALCTMRSGGLRLVYLPPYTPELQPVETLWVHLDEPAVNRHFNSLADLDEAVARQCVALNSDRDRIRSQAGFHWWPDRVVPN